MAGAPENRGKKNEKESFSLFPHVPSGISCGTGSGEGVPPRHSLHLPVVLLGFYRLC